VRLADEFIRRIEKRTKKLATIEDSKIDSVTTIRRDQWQVAMRVVAYPSDIEKVISFWLTLIPTNTTAQIHVILITESAFGGKHQEESEYLFTEFDVDVFMYVIRHYSKNL
jgi:hypothetical protein